MLQPDPASANTSQVVADTDHWVWCRANFDAGPTQCSLATNIDAAHCFQATSRTTINIELTYQHSPLAKALAFTVAASCVTLGVLPSTKKATESDAEWQAGMLAEAPNSDKLMPGRLQAYAYDVKQLLSVAGSWCK